MVCDSAPVLPHADERSGSLTYESPPSTYSDPTKKKKTKRVMILDESVVTGFRYKFVYPPLKDRSVK